GTDGHLEEKHPGLRQGVSAGLRDWRRELSGPEIERFEAAAGGLLDTLGYPRGASSPSAHALADARRLRARFAGRPLPDRWGGAARPLLTAWQTTQPTRAGEWLPGRDYRRLFTEAGRRARCCRTRPSHGTCSPRVSRKSPRARGGCAPAGSPG